MTEPKIGSVRQDQVRGSAGGDQRFIGYKDDISVDFFNVINAQSSSNTLIDDLNYIRTALRNLHGGSSWYDIIQNGAVREPIITRNVLSASLVNSALYMSLDASLQFLSLGMMACLLTSNNYPSPVEGVYGRIGAADARVVAAAVPFYNLLGVVLEQPAGGDTYLKYRLCTRGHSGLYQIFTTQGGATELYIVPGETYFLGENGEIVTESVALPRFEAGEWRLQRIGYGIFDSAVDPATQNPYQGMLFVDPGDPVQI